MGSLRFLYFVWLTLALFLSLGPQSSHGRAHYHEKKHDRGTPHISLPPASSPAHSPSHPHISNPSIFNVRSFGAVGDGTTDDKQAFRKAWKAACHAESGGGRLLLVPSGGFFMITSLTFSGPCRPGLVFQVEGVLMPPEGPDNWPESDDKQHWLVFHKVDGMTLTGPGVIQGRGEKWWNLPCKPHRGPHGTTRPGPCDSPALIKFTTGKNLRIMDLQIKNSPQVHVKFDGCIGVHIERVSISSPGRSPNTDGIHIEDTKSVGIYDSILSTGDDCISIGSGCSAVHIENVHCGPSHGISIGSLGRHNSKACVSNITVRDSVIRNSDNGVRIKTWQGGRGSVSDIRFERITMDNVRNSIIIDQYYCKHCQNQTSAVYITNVSYRSIIGTYDVRSPPMKFACSDTVACTNITMSEVKLLPSIRGEESLHEPFCWNAYGALETLTVPPIYCLRRGQPENLGENSIQRC